MKYTHNKSNQNQANDTARRKILLGLGGGVVGATQLPKTWSKPIINSVLLPAHAQTSLCTIDINFVVNAPGGSLDGSYNYTLSIFPSNELVEEISVPYTNSLNDSYSIIVAPGQYVIDTGSGAANNGNSPASGLITISCCSASEDFGGIWIANPDGGNGSDGIILITIGADGTCQIDPGPI